MKTFLLTNPERSARSSRSGRAAHYSLAVGLFLCALAGIQLIRPCTAVAGASSKRPVVERAASAASEKGAPEATNTSAKPTATNSLDVLDDKYILAVGDRLSYRIVEDRVEAKPLTVTDSGDVEFPYIGRFAAVGKSCRELARALKAELEKDYYYHATVLIAVDSMSKNRGRVYLVGPVRVPGPQEIPNDETLTLSKAILRAGGFSDFADKKSVKVTRKVAGKDKTFTVNVAEILEKGKTAADMPLEAGDFIYVPERGIRF